MVRVVEPAMLAGEDRQFRARRHQSEPVANQHFLGADVVVQFDAFNLARVRRGEHEPLDLHGAGP